MQTTTIIRAAAVLAVAGGLGTAYGQGPPDVSIPGGTDLLGEPFSGPGAWPGATVSGAWFNVQLEPGSVLDGPGSNRLLVENQAWGPDGYIYTAGGTNEGDVDLRSGVLCCPNNYPEAKEPTVPVLRATHLASSRRWFQKTDDQYRADKEAMVRGSMESVSKLMGPFGSHVRFTDAFTPRTIHHYTGHEGGAIYGAPSKRRSAETGADGVFLIGTDQGMSGIVGAMLSGVTVANERILRT